MFKMQFKNKLKGINAIGFDVGHTLIKYNTGRDFIVQDWSTLPPLPILLYQRI